MKEICDGACLMNPTSYLLVAVGGAIGSVGRAWVGIAAARLFGLGFPWGTMIINILGSAIIGIIAATALSPSRTILSPEIRIFLMVGFCGGFTTFSSFSLQTLRLAQDGQWLWAAANVLASNVGCLLAVWLGHVCAVGLRR